MWAVGGVDEEIVAVGVGLGKALIGWEGDAGLPESALVFIVDINAEGVIRDFADVLDGFPLKTLLADWVGAPETDQAMPGRPRCFTSEVEAFVPEAIPH